MGAVKFGYVILTCVDATKAYVSPIAEFEASRGRYGFMEFWFVLAILSVFLWGFRQHFCQAGHPEAWSNSDGRPRSSH